MGRGAYLLRFTQVLTNTTRVQHQTVIRAEAGQAKVRNNHKNHDSLEEPPTIFTMTREINVHEKLRPPSYAVLLMTSSAEPIKKVSCGAFRAVVTVWPVLELLQREYMIIIINNCIVALNSSEKSSYRSE